MGTEAVKAFRRTWGPRAKRASSPSCLKQGADSLQTLEAGHDPDAGQRHANRNVTETASFPRAPTPLPRPSEAALRVQAEGATQPRRTSGIRLKPNTPALDARLAPSEEIPTQPGRRRDLHARPTVQEWVQEASNGGSIQKTFAAPHRRNAREPTDHDVQIISVYAPPPLPNHRHEASGFAQVELGEIEVLLDPSAETSDAILETQVIPFVADVAPSRLRRWLVGGGFVALAAAVGILAYTFAPKIVGLLRLPASVATVSDASKPLPTPVARPTLTVATPAAPSVTPIVSAVAEQAPASQAVVTELNQAVHSDVAVEQGGSSATRADVEHLTPTTADIGSGSSVQAKKLIARAKHKKSRRLRMRLKRAKQRAKEKSEAVAAAEK